MALKPDKLAKLRSRLERMTDLADELNGAVRQAHDALESLESSDGPLKDQFGKLTDLGVETVFDMFDHGKANWEVAEHLQISPSAVVYQRKRYEVRRATTKA